MSHTGAGGEQAEVPRWAPTGDRKLPSVSELWRATAVVPRVKPNIRLPKARTPAGVSEGLS